MKSSFLLSFLVTVVPLAGPSSFAFEHTDISIPDANDMIQSDPNIIVVDVREDSEYCGSLGHIACALNYPWNSGYFENHYQDFAATDQLLLVCRSGGRSNVAATFIDSQDYEHVYDMLGGMFGWKSPTYGYDTVDCVDSDRDGFNDDIDNCPDTYNPSQADPVNQIDFAFFAADWLITLDPNDLGVFALYWLADCIE